MERGFLLPTGGKMRLLLLIVVLMFSTQKYVPITPYNAGDIEVLRNIRLNETFGNAIAFNPRQSTQLAVAQANGFVSLWDVSTGRRLYWWQTSYQGGVNAVAYMPDGWHLVIANDDGQLQIWPLASGLEYYPSVTVRGAIPVSLDVSQNGLLAVGYKNGEVRIWNPRTGKLMIRFYGYEEPVIAVDISPDETELLFGYPSGQAFLYRLDLSTQQAHLERIFGTRYYVDEQLVDVAFPPVGFPAFLGTGLVLLNNGSSAEFRDLIGLEGASWTTDSELVYPSRMSFNRSGKLLAIAGTLAGVNAPCEGNRCRVEIIRHGRILTSLKSVADYPFTDIAFNADDRFLAASTTDGLITIWAIPSTIQP
jgi:WD40 repeat protein